MWRCKNCETLNDAEFCIVCGEEKTEAKENKEVEIYNKEKINEKIEVSKKGNREVEIRNKKKIIEKQEVPKKENKKSKWIFAGINGYLQDLLK